MNTINEINARMTELISWHGTIQFIAQRTLLPEARVERIYELGDPWPTLDDAPQLPCIRPVLSGDISAKSLDLLEQFRQTNFEFKIAKFKAFFSARTSGDVSAFDAEREWIDPIIEHLEEVAQLANEEIEIIYEVFQGEIERERLYSDLNDKLAQLISESP